MGNISEGEVEYLSKSLTSIDSKVGPLAIRAAEWFALMCESAGLKGTAVNINEIHSSPSHVFEVISYDAENLCLRGADDNVIEISRDNFAGLPDRTLSTRKYMISAVINYQSRWFVNGMTSWSNDEEVFKSEKDRLKETHLHAEFNAYEEMLAENQGRPIFYFKNSDEMMKHIERFVDAEPQFKMPQDSKSWRNIVLFVNSDSNLSICVNRAACIKDPKNPFYNKRVAETEAFNLLGNVEAVPKELMDYLLKNKMIPDARVNSIYGPERGS